MENPIIQEFYNRIAEFVKNYQDNINHDYSEEKIDEIIRNIPNIIRNFKEPNTEEEYRMLAKKQDGTLATIQITDSKTGYKIYKPISSEEYKNLYYECLMYCLVCYQMFFQGWKYEIISDSEDKSKCGNFEIKKEQLPHILGIDNKLMGKSALLSNIIPDYSNHDEIEQILLIIFNYEKIKDYESKNGVEIFNYYKSMQKVKDFLLLGRFFNEFRMPFTEQNNIAIVDREESNNQLYLYKKSNMKSVSNRDIIKLIIQRSSDGNFFARSIQSVSDEIEKVNEAIYDLRNGVRILKDLPEDVRGVLKSKNLILVDEGFTWDFNGYSIKLKENESLINPWIFMHNEFKASGINYDDLMQFMKLINSEEKESEKDIKKDDEEIR